MKKTKIFALVFAAAGLLTSCDADWLEVQNPNGEPLEEYYVNEKTLTESLNAAYDPIHWPDWGLGQYNALNIDAEIMGDNVWVGGSDKNDMANWHKLADFEADGNNTFSSLWTVDYSGVKRCNDLLRYLSRDGISISADLKKSYEMQARLLRVYYYNNLWHYFGNIPFFLENLTASNGYTAPQLSADEVYAKLIVELEAVIESNVLPMRAADKDCGRVTQALAYMLYAEMAMYQNDKARYGKALEYMQTLISSGQYQLESDFAHIWTEEGEWCKESIWEINYNDNNNERGWSSPLAVGGTILPCLIGPNSWPGGDGFDAGQDGWGFMPIRVATYDMYEAGDTRRDATIWDVRGTSYTERYEDTHLWLAKYRPITANLADAGFDSNLNYNNNLRMYRYAETLLNAAELLLETGGSAAQAAEYVNQVRTRAGVAPLASVTKEDVINERHLEFVGEGKRYFDLVRTGLAATVIVPSKWADNNGYRTNPWTPNKKYIPIADSELSSDPNLKQNMDYFK